MKKARGVLQQRLRPVKPFTNFFLILSALASLAIAQSASGAPPSGSDAAPNAERSRRDRSFRVTQFRQLIPLPAMMKITVTWPTQRIELSRWT